MYLIIYGFKNRVIHPQVVLDTFSHQTKIMLMSLIEKNRMQNGECMGNWRQETENWKE